MGAAAVPIITTLVAAGASEANNRRTARKKDEEAARGIRENAKIRREATEKVNQTVDKTAESNADSFREGRMSSMQMALAKARQQGLANISQGGAISDTAKAYQGQGGAAATDYAGNLASLFSVMDAAADQRMSEGNVRGDASMDLTRLGGDAGQSEFLTRLRANQHRNNPWVDAAAAGLSGYGVAKSQGGGP